MPKWGITYHTVITSYTVIEAETKEAAEEVFYDYSTRDSDVWTDMCDSSEDIIDNITEVKNK